MQCHGSVTVLSLKEINKYNTIQYKTIENPDKGDRTVTRCSSVANLVSGMFKFKLQ